MVALTRYVLGTNGEDGWCVEMLKVERGKVGMMY